MKFNRKRNIAQLKNNLDQLEQKMSNGHYGSVLESLNSLKEKVVRTKSVELSRSFSEIDLRAEQGINKTKDEINSLLILVEKSISIGNHENSDLKLSRYNHAHRELKQIQDKCNKKNLGPDFKHQTEKINKIKEIIDQFYSDVIKGGMETTTNLTEQRKFDESIVIIWRIFNIMENIFNYELQNEIKERIKAKSDLIYSTIIKSEITAILELNDLKKFDGSIKKLENALDIAKDIYDLKLQKELIETIKTNSDLFCAKMIKSEIITSLELSNLKKFDESIKKLENTLNITTHISDLELQKELLETINTNSDLFYAKMIKSERNTSLELSNLKKFDESIKKLENTLNFAKNIYEFKLQNESIEEINQLIFKIRIAKIKNTVLDLGIRFPRLQASDIAENCGEDEGLIVSTIKEMIVNEEIYAMYFENSRSVAFDQRVIEREIEKITERLDNQFEEWGKKEKSKTGKM